MPESLRLTLLWAALLVFLVASLAFRVWVGRRNRRNRRIAREHPERLPRGRRLILRIAPMAALGGAGVVWGIATRQWGIAIPAAVAVLSFGWTAYKAATDPNYPPPPRS